MHQFGALLMSAGTTFKQFPSEQPSLPVFRAAHRGGAEFAKEAVSQVLHFLLFLVKPFRHGVSSAGWCGTCNPRVQVIKFE